MGYRQILNFGYMNTLLVLFFTLFSAVQCTKVSSTESASGKYSNLRLLPAKKPVLLGKPGVSAYELKIQCEESGENMYLSQAVIRFTPASQTDCIASLGLANTSVVQSIPATSQQIGAVTTVSGPLPLHQGVNFINVIINLKDNASLTNSFDIGEMDFTFGDQKTVKITPDSKFANRPAILLRAAGQD